MMAGESGFAGAGGWFCCAARRGAAAHISTITAQRIDIIIAAFLLARNGSIDGLTNLSVVQGPVVAPYRVS
jgi:hypothetical protein